MQQDDQLSCFTGYQPYSAPQLGTVDGADTGLEAAREVARLTNLARHPGLSELTGLPDPPTSPGVYDLAAEDSDEDDMGAYLRSDKQAAVYHELLERLGAPAAGRAAGGSGGGAAVVP